MNQKAIILLLSSINFLYAGLPKDTLIKADESYITIQQLSPLEVK